MNHSLPGFLHVRPAVRSFLVFVACLSLGELTAAPTFPVSGENSALRLTIVSVTPQPNYGSAAASPGHQFIVLKTEWENRIDPKLAETRGLATSYLVEELANHLYLVMDGRWLGQLRGQLKRSDGQLSLAGMQLDKSGAKRAGEIVFELPAGKPRSLDLRFYDDTTGYIKLALGEPAPVSTPLQPLQKNEIAEVGVYAVENPAAGISAPSGFRAIAIDLRARSLWTITGDAPAYDSAQPPGAQIPHVNLLDWPETRKYIHVLAEGDFAFPPQENSPLPDTARFIPEFMTGGRLIFLVPAAATSLQLFCEMPHAAAPGGGAIDLPPMHFPLVGAEPPADSSKPFLAIQDEMFAISFTTIHPASTFATIPAGEGKQFVVLGVTVSNQGQTGEFFQPREQLLQLEAGGAETPPDEITASGVHRPEDLVHLPAGSHRRFEVVYKMDQAARTLKLSFHGGSFMKSYDLVFAP